VGEKPPGRLHDPWLSLPLGFPLPALYPKSPIIGRDEPTKIIFKRKKYYQRRPRKNHRDQSRSIHGMGGFNDLLHRAIARTVINHNDLIIRICNILQSLQTLHSIVSRHPFQFKIIIATLGQVPRPAPCTWLLVRSISISQPPLTALPP
jgi:hypothetical protein